MHKILEKRQLSYDKERDQSVYYFKVEAPEIARNRKAGQFIIFQLDEDYGERIPLTIADANAEEGWIAIVFQTVGATTRKGTKNYYGTAECYGNNSSGYAFGETDNIFPA